jgi:hypothetical protein
LLLLLLCWLGRTFTATTAGTAATTTSAAATRRALALRLLLLRLRLRLLLLLLLIALRTFAAWRSLIAASTFATFARRTLSRRTALFFSLLLARPLLELLHLPLHELPRL